MAIMGSIFSKKKFPFTSWYFQGLENDTGISKKNYSIKKMFENFGQHTFYNTD